MPAYLARPPRRASILLFLLIWFAIAWFGSDPLNANNATRLFAATSLVEQGDATIDEFAGLTIDKAAFDGHVVPDKAPGMALVAVPAVAAVTAVTGERSADVRIAAEPAFERFLQLRLRVAAAIGPALLTALAAVLLWSLAAELTGSVPAGLFAALAYALGTPIWGWSTTIVGHAVVTDLFVIAVWAIRRAGTRAPAALVAGLALGWAVAVEFQAALAGSVIAIWGAWRFLRDPARVRLVALAVVGAGAALLPVLGYNLLVFGEPFRAGYSGVIGFTGMKVGFFGLTWPDPHALVSVLALPRRGIIWVAPILVAAPFGIRALWRRDRALTITALATAAVVVLVNASYVYWDGGDSTGPRHAMPAVGLLALFLAPVWAAASKPIRSLLALLLAGSIAINLMIAAAEVTAPVVHRWPLVDLILPRFLSGAIRDLPSQFWGWSPWAGLALGAAIAAVLAVALVRALRLPGTADPAIRPALWTTIPSS
jgi:hypothetical protein